MSDRGCTLSITWYLHGAVDADRAAGHEIGDATIAHLTTARFEAINPYGLLTSEVAKILNRTNRRPLRTPLTRISSSARFGFDAVTQMTRGGAAGAVAG